MSRDQAGDVASTHYESLRQYLSSYLQSQRNAGGPSNQRSSAREKLTRLTKQQFTELSTDVFDEMNRRQLDSRDAPFLPVRDDFHPKRNQARQKLATLPSSRFKDLASDVYFEIERRFPTVVQQFVAKYGDRDLRGPSPVPNGQYEPEAKQVQVVNVNAAPAYVGGAQPHQYEERSARGDMGQSQSQKPVDAVNFTSLDNLMADLGSMLTHPKGPNGTEELERIRSEYESRMEIMQRRITELEAEVQEGAGRKERIAQLEERLASEEAVSAVSAGNLEVALLTGWQFASEQASTLSALEAKHKKLKEDFDSLQDDYNNQQQIANDIRSEATNLLEEIRNLSRKNDALTAEKEQDQQTIRQLKDELAHANSNTQRSSYEPNRRQTLDTTIDSQDGGAGDEDGIIDRSRVTAYQNAVGELLQAARSDTPTSVLVAMKGIVIACKNITEDTEAFENSSESLTPEERDQLSDTKNNLSAALTNLMTAAKNHATSYGAANIADLEGAASELTATIVGLVKMLRLKGGERGGDRGMGGEGGYEGGRKERPASYEIDELKVFLEKQTDSIVQAIQSLLYAMRQSTTFGQEFKDTVSGITTIVDNLVTVSRRTLSKPSASDFRTRGELILQDLAAANQKLEELGESMVSSPQSKSLKQRLASSSYEIAKYVKELISLIE
ncbi:component of the polarisome [Rhizophlyctis rosea]|nr:component of the polarisome [Rhizophlyctis rosea]